MSERAARFLRHEKTVALGATGSCLSHSTRRSFRSPWYTCLSCSRVCISHERGTVITWTVALSFSSLMISPIRRSFPTRMSSYIAAPPMLSAMTTGPETFRMYLVGHKTFVNFEFNKRSSRRQRTSPDKLGQHRFLRLKLAHTHIIAISELLLYSSRLIRNTCTSFAKGFRRRRTGSQRYNFCKIGFYTAMIEWHTLAKAQTSHSRSPS
jgi:hypothetical protein